MKERKKHICKSYQPNNGKLRCQFCGKEKSYEDVERIMFEQSKVEHEGSCKNQDLR